MGIRNDRGIVLRSYPFGEADRVVVLLSPDSGKLRTVAKGVRKTMSRFGGRLEPFTQVRLVVYEGRNLDTITQVDIEQGFPALRSELDRVSAASVMVETVDAVAIEGHPSQDLFGLLRSGLEVLDVGPPHPDLVTAFLLHLSDEVGVAPSLGVCASCGRPAGGGRFSLVGGGEICDDCHVMATVKVRHGLTGYLHAMTRVTLDRLPPVDPALTGDALGLVRRFVEHHLERRIASLGVTT